MYTAMCSRYLKGIPAKYRSQEREVSNSGYDMVVGEGEGVLSLVKNWKDAI
jgi:hypothetical protein